MAASLLKTLNASAGVRIPAASNVLNVSIATMSSVNFSQTISANVAPSKPKTMSICQVTGGFASGMMFGWAACRPV